MSFIEDLKNICPCFFPDVEPEEQIRMPYVHPLKPKALTLSEIFQEKIPSDKTYTFKEFLELEKKEK